LKIFPFKKTYTKNKVSTTKIFRGKRNFEIKKIANICNALVVDNRQSACQLASIQNQYDCRPRKILVY
jgi:hypothetical protein